MENDRLTTFMLYTLYTTADMTSGGSRPWFRGAKILTLINNYYNIYMNV